MMAEIRHLEGGRGLHILLAGSAGSREFRESLQPARDAAEQGMREVRRILDARAR